MPNNGNDLVIINLDRPRKLWAGNRAMMMIEKLTGKPITQLDENISAGDVLKIMYALLDKDAREHHETLTMEQVADLLDEVQYGTVVERMTAALSAAFGTEDDGKNAQTAAEPSGIGE